MAKKTKQPESDSANLEPESEVEVEPAESVEASAKDEPAAGKTTAKPAQKKSNGKKGKSNEEAELAPEKNGISKPPASRRKLTLIISGVGVALIASGIAGYLVFGSGSKDDGQPSNGNANTNASNLVRRVIDGVLDTPEHENRYPVAVMVENHTQARPQSGLDRANIVYNALAEGGITRFLAVFTLTNPVEEIGPVRSARSYYVDWARGYDAMYVHAGGSPSGLSRITSVGLTDLNQFFNSQYFYRDRSRNVASEHTLYTTSTLLSRAIVDKKLPTDGSFEGWTYKSDAGEAERGTSQTITIDYSSFSYKVGYTYDPATNSYKRFQAEQPHVMRNGAALAPKNVVIIRVNRSLENSSDDHGRLAMTTTGSGPAQFFIDGKVSDGTWKKNSAQSELELLDAAGRPVKLNAGQTWVEVVPPELGVTVE